MLPPFEVVAVQASSGYYDNLAVLIDGTAVMPMCVNGGGFCAIPPVLLKAGFRKVVVTFYEDYGDAVFALQMGFNGSGFTALPSWRVFPIQPGTATPVTLTINGARLPLACGATTLNATLAPSGTSNVTAAAAAEPTSVSVPGGTCAYMYSSVHYSPADMSAVQVSAGPTGGCRGSKIGSSRCVLVASPIESRLSKLNTRGYPLVVACSCVCRPPSYVLCSQWGDGFAECRPTASVPQLPCWPCRPGPRQCWH